MDKVVLNNSDSNLGFNRILLDLVYNLTSGPLVDSNFRYEDQLNYYGKKILGETVTLDELKDYAEKHKRVTRIMFPNSPSLIRSKTFLIKLFASFVVLHTMYQCEAFNEVADEVSFTDRCLNKYTFHDELTLECYTKEVRYLYSQYMQGLNSESYDVFRTIMYTYIDKYTQVFQNIADISLEYKANITKDSFTVLCEKFKIQASQKTLFKLQVDALSETKVCENDYVEYYESLKDAWNSRFPNYTFCEEIRTYINEHKRPFVLIYGSQIRSLRKDIQLFEMLACVHIKIALANGAKNTKQLDSMIRSQTYGLAPNLRNFFIDNKKKFMSYYHLDGNLSNNFADEINAAMIPFKKDLMILNELIMEEINFRNQDNTVSKVEQKLRKNEKNISEYEFLLSEKEAEIHNLKKDLEYYENLEAQNFKSEVSQYDKALTDLFQKLCDPRFGSVINKLYLISNGKQTESEEQIKALLQNMFFIFSSIGINPYEINKIGKKVRFYDDEANIIYSVDDSLVKEGINIGTVKFPGWKFKDNEWILPKVEINEEDE